MCATAILSEMRSVIVSTHDSETEMDGNQDPRLGQRGFVNGSDDTELHPPRTATSQTLHDGESLPRSHKRGGSPSLDETASPRKILKEVATNGLRHQPQSETEDFRNPSEHSTQSMAIDYTNQADSQVKHGMQANEDGGQLGENGPPFTQPKKLTKGERLHGSWKDLSVPHSASHQLLHETHESDWTVDSMSDFKAVQLLLNLSSNGAHENDNKDFPNLSESNRATSPLEALGSEFVKNSKPKTDQIAASGPSATEAISKSTQQDMAMNDSSDHAISQSPGPINETVNPRIKQISISEQEPHTPAAEGEDRASKYSKPQSAVQPVAPMPAPKDSKTIHKWATHNDMRPYDVAMKIHEGRIAELDDPAKAVAEEAYNDGYRYWTLSEYKVLLTEQGQGKSWQDIAKELPGRDADECRNRWEKKDTIKVPDAGGRHPHWHKEEEDILQQLRSAGLNFEAIAKKLPARSAAGCKTRWKEKFEPPRKPEPRSWVEEEANRKPWTEKEDKQLKKLRKDGWSWKQIALKLGARSKKVYQERWKELDYRKRGPQPPSEDPNAPALRHEAPSPNPSPVPPSDIRDYADPQAPPRPIEGSHGTSIRDAEYPHADGSFSRPSTNNYTSVQGPQSIYTLGKYAQGFRAHRDRSTPSGYDMTLPRDAPRQQYTLPPIQTLEYPHSAPPLHTGAIYLHNHEYYPNDPRRALDSECMHRGSRSAVEPRLSHAPAPVQQRALPQQNEHHLVLYRREGNGWQVTELVDPIHQCSLRGQAPQTHNQFVAQLDAYPTDNGVIFRRDPPSQPQPYQPQYTPSSVKHYSIPQASNDTGDKARRSHQGRVVQAANPNLNYHTTGILHHVKDPGSSITNHNTSQTTRAMTRSEYNLGDPRFPRFNGPRQPFTTTGSRPCTPTQCPRTSESSPRRLSNPPESASRSPNPHRKKPTFGTYESATRVSGHDTEFSPHKFEIPDLKDSSSSALPHEHDGGPRSIYHGNDNKIQCG